MGGSIDRRCLDRETGVLFFSSYTDFHRRIRGLRLVRFDIDGTMNWADTHIEGKAHIFDNPNIEQDGMGISQYGFFLSGH